MMRHYSRREILRAGAGAAAIAMLPRPLWARSDGPSLGLGPDALMPIAAPDVKELALAAIAAAREAGATYADVRLTHTYTRQIDGRITDAEAMHVGVRALADGYWGFASSPYWNKDEMARLGTAAVSLAKANVLSAPRRIELAPVAKVIDEHWEAPVKRDPFKDSPYEIVDFLSALGTYANAQLKTTVRGKKFGALARFNYDCVLQEKAFASTEGSYVTQRLIRSDGSATLWVPDAALPFVWSGLLDFSTPTAVGWELYADQATVRAAMEQLFAEMLPESFLPVVPIPVGRYDMVFDARGVAQLTCATLARATELDRAMGYEANAGGTSYVSDPVGMLGNYVIGAEALTVTANRTEPGGCATVKWDDDGVAPEPFTLIKNGVLNDFPTARESATWLAGPYGQRQQAMRSHGCAAAPTALEAPMLQPPNLVIAPGTEDLDLAALVSSLKTGILVRFDRATADVEMDFQALNGMAPSVTCFMVKNGKIASRIGGIATNGIPGILFRSPELWKGILALGGSRSTKRYGVSTTKGEPAQELFYSVTAPPAVFKQLAIIDSTRRP